MCEVVLAGAFACAGAKAADVCADGVGGWKHRGSASCVLNSGSPLSGVCVKNTFIDIRGGREDSVDDTDDDTWSSPCRRRSMSSPPSPMRQRRTSTASTETVAEEPEDAAEEEDASPMPSFQMPPVTGDAVELLEGALSPQLWTPLPSPGGAGAGGGPAPANPPAAASEMGLASMFNFEREEDASPMPSFQMPPDTSDAAELLEGALSPQLWTPLPSPGGAGAGGGPAPANPPPAASEMGLASMFNFEREAPVEAAYGEAPAAPYCVEGSPPQWDIRPPATASGQSWEEIAHQTPAQWEPPQQRHGRWQQSSPTRCPHHWEECPTRCPHQWDESPPRSPQRWRAAYPRDEARGMPPCRDMPPAPPGTFFSGASNRKSQQQSSRPSGAGQLILSALRARGMRAIEAANIQPKGALLQRMQGQQSASSSPSKSHAASRMSPLPGVFGRNGSGTGTGWPREDGAPKLPPTQAQHQRSQQQQQPQPPPQNHAQYQPHQLQPQAYQHRPQAHPQHLEQGELQPPQYHQPRYQPPQPQPQHQQPPQQPYAYQQPPQQLTQFQPQAHPYQPPPQYQQYQAPPQPSQQQQQMSPMQHGRQDGDVDSQSPLRGRRSRTSLTGGRPGAASPAAATPEGPVPVGLLDRPASGMQQGDIYTSPPTPSPAPPTASDGASWNSSGTSGPR